MLKYTQGHVSAAQQKIQQKIGLLLNKSRCFNSWTLTTIVTLMIKESGVYVKKMHTSITYCSSDMNHTLLLLICSISK